MQNKLNNAIETFDSQIQTYLNAINLSDEIKNNIDIVRVSLAKIIIEFEYFVIDIHFNFLLDYVEVHKELGIYLRETIFSRSKYNLEFSLNALRKIIPVFDKIWNFKSSPNNKKSFENKIKLIHEARNNMNHTNYLSSGNLPAGFSSLDEAKNTINEFLLLFKKRYDINLKFIKVDFKI